MRGFKCFFTMNLHFMFNNYITLSLHMIQSPTETSQISFPQLLSLKYKMDNTELYRFLWDLDQCISRVNGREHFWRGQLSVEQHVSSMNTNLSNKLLFSI